MYFFSKKGSRPSSLVLPIAAPYMTDAKEDSVQKMETMEEAREICSEGGLKLDSFWDLGR